MESAPPTYAKATSVNYWDLIARYMPSNDLCSAALVCERWHTTFTPHLWGNPASHFGIENDRVYVALTRFKRTLQIARLNVRSLTHTLHLPPAHAEIYNGPHADWLRDILERLPNLQSLIVRGLPFFDHSALQGLTAKRSTAKANQDEPVPGMIELPASMGLAFQRLENTMPCFGLRLLDASRCSNVTSSSLAHALSRFRDLLYLDLSFTYPARDPIVLKTIRRFTGLEVLRLRGVSLTDEALDTLAPAIGRRVRSLDLRDNHISDRGIRTLLDDCFITDATGLAPGQRSPAILPYMGPEMLDIYQGEDFESFIRNAFTGRFVGRLAIEDAPEGGITHLYIAGNPVSVEGVSGLVRSGRLHVLDVQSVTSGRRRHSSTSPYDGDEAAMAMPGAEKLTPLISKYASDGLKFLRVDHSIITKDAPNMFAEEPVQGRHELADTALPDIPQFAAELDGTSMPHDAFEMPTVHTPRHELAGDPMQFIVSPAANNDAPLETPPMSGPRRGSAFAPEVVESLAARPDFQTLLSPVSALEEGTMLDGWLNNGIVSPNTPTVQTFSFTDSARPTTRPRSYSSVADERKARLNAHVALNQNLHPAMVPNLSTLVLTDIPSFSSTKELSNRLLCFVRQCAEEAWLAKCQAKLDYALPPGRKGHAAALKHSADKIFALKRLVLELAPDPNTRRSSKASPWQSMTTRSMTEDRDSETLWSAAETDFSFFGDEDYSFPSLESGRFAQSPGFQGKEVIFGNGFSWQDGVGVPKTPVLPRFDTVDLLSKFRKERKLAHQRQIIAGAIDPETEGYWPGVVSVVRPGTSNIREEVDYYGNRFENGYLYR